jgi:hypothetical protein
MNMRVKTILVSPEGAWFRGDGPALHQAVGYPEPDFDAAGFAVRNLGYIKFETIADVLLDVEFHPLHVSRRALEGARHHLAAVEHRLVRLRYLVEDWRTELAINPAQAALRLGEICAPYAPVSADQTFSVTPLGERALFEREDEGALRLFFQKWRASFRQFDDTVLPFAAKRGLAESMVIVGLKRGESEPVFRYIGAQFWGFGQDFFLRAVGERVQQQPDKRFGAWVVQFYREVAATRQPRYDRVEARIEHSARGPQYCYDRLMLPWSTPGGEVLITSCSRFLSDRLTEAPASDPARKLSKSS